MSKENVGKFYHELATDETLRMKLSELNKQYQGETMDAEKKAALVEKLVLPLAEEKGLTFSMEDMRQYEEEMVKANTSDEISIEELDTVAGGAGAALGFCVVVGGALAVDLGMLCVFVGLGA